jgi:2-hydroxychromene-2-carboxylate isomerase
MTKRQFTLYTDYKSPYAYLAKDPAFELAEEVGADLIVRPFTLDIPNAFGDLDVRTDAQWRKVRYLYQDVRRFANQRGMRILGPRKVFDSTIAAIGMLYAQRQGCFRAYHDDVFHRFFLRELDIEQPSLVIEALAKAGADAAGFEDFLAGEGRDLLERSNAEGLEHGAFGVPTFVVDGELFWGHDRIDFVRERLLGSDADT